MYFIELDFKTANFDFLKSSPDSFINIEFLIKIFIIQSNLIISPTTEIPFFNSTTTNEFFFLFFLIKRLDNKRVIYISKETSDS